MTDVARNDSRYWAMAATFTAIWAIGFPVSKLAVATCPPELFLAFRMLAAGALMLAWAFWRGYLAAPVPWLQLAGLGLVGFALTNGAAWKGITTVTSGLATIIMSANPVLTGIVAAALLGDKLTAKRALGLALGIGGVAFVVRNRIVIGGEDPVGVALLFGAICTQTTATILYKSWSPRLPLSVLVGGQMGFAGLALLAYGLLFEQASTIQLNPTFWLTYAYATILNSIVSFQLWFYVLSRGSATSVTSLQFLMPPLGLLFSWLMLGESIQWLDLLGIVPIAVGIRLTTRPAEARQAALAGETAR